MGRGSGQWLCAFVVAIVGMAPALSVVPQKGPTGSPAAAAGNARENRLWAISKRPRWQVRKTLYVDGSASAGSDTNAGTKTAPFQTISAALRHVAPGTRIVIAPGTYRETLVLRRKDGGTPDAPVVIEAAKKGTVVLSGSDVWAGWKPGEVPGVYRHEWPYKWGFSNDPFPDYEPTQPMGRRREMVFVDGEHYRQVEKLADLRPKTFFVSEENQTVSLCAPANKEIGSARVEVAMREDAIDMGSMWSEPDGPEGWPRNLVIRGLTVQHCATRPLEPAFDAFGENLLIEDCRVLWNNGTGIALRGKDVVMRGNVADHNGSLGLSVPPTVYPALFDALLEDNTTSDNNWRGDMGGFHGFAVAGMKIMTSGNLTLRRHRAERNASPGIWLDKENRNVLIDDCRMFDNKNGPGLWLEISEGPFWVRNTVSAFNQTGLLISNSSQITVTGSTFYGNRTDQIGEWSPAMDRDGFFDVGLTLRDNVIVSTDPAQMLFRRPDYPNIYSTLKSSRNLWFSPGPRGWNIGTRPLDFSGWVSETREDADSLFAAPNLVDPLRYDFRPSGTSPVSTRDAWGTRAVVSIYPSAGLIGEFTKMYLSSRSGLPIHYTLDGSEPTGKSPRYTGPFPIQKTATVRARAIGPNLAYNPVASALMLEGAPAQPEVSLTDLTAVKNVVGWGNEARKNRSIQDKPLSVAGIVFDQGIGAHANSELVYDLKPEYRRFVAVAGIDDEVAGEPASPAVVFSVYADETLLVKTAELSQGKFAGIDVNIPAGAKQLRLMVTSTRANQEWAHADWVRAGFRKEAR